MPPNKFRPTKIRDIALNKNDILANLYKHSLAILALQNAVRHGLDQSVASHVHIASLDPKNITIYTDNQAWATKLRFQTAEVLKIARKFSGYSGLESLKIRVSPTLIDHSSTTETPVAMSTATSRLLAKVAENINDTALQDALKNLSRNSK